MLGLRRWVVMSVAIVALGCGGGTATVSSPSIATSPSPTATASPSPTPLPIAGAPCGSGQKSMRRVITACGDVEIKQDVVKLPTLYFHYDPKVPNSVQKYVERIANKYLPIYSGFFDEISDAAQIHIVLSLTPSWCGKKLTETDDGTEADLFKNYCQQDGGANGGHGTTRYAEYGSIILRPHPNDIPGILAGETTSDMLTEIMVAELGHASRDVGSDAITGERGIAKWTPTWLNYVPNQFGWFYSGIREELSVSDEFLATWGNRDLAWRPTVSDERFTAWNIINEWQLGDMQSPSLYNVAHLAMRYLVPKHGLSAITRDLMGTLFRTQGDYNLAAERLGYSDWADLEQKVDESIIEYYQSEGIKVPRK